MGMLRTVLAALWIAGYGQTAFAQPAQEDAFIAAIKAMKRSVSPVVCVRAPLQQPQFGSQRPPRAPQYQSVIDGTAFFISRRGDFITASHVLDDFAPGKPLANCPPTVWYEGAVVPGGFGGVAFVAALSDCIRDAALDIARCHTITT